MTSRRGLVSRGHLNDGATSSPARSRNSELPETHTPLPPYEPLSYPLTAAGKQALVHLGLSYASRFTKYKSDIEEAIKTITAAATEGHDRLYDRKEELKRAAKKREKADAGDEKTEEEQETEIIAVSLERKVEDMTKKAEKALRDLIDYKAELEMQQPILQEVCDNIPDQPTQPRGSRGQRRQQRLGDEDEESMDVAEEEGLEAPATNASILSTVELLKKAKEDYAKSYTSLTMHRRYAENNDYKGFKRQIHDALNPGPEAPPVPHPSTWFPKENESTPMARRRRLAADDADDGEDEVVIARATTNLKCPLTLQMFEVPYSNNICNHSFEKSAIIEYYNDNAVVFAEPGQGGRKRGQPVGPKKVQCPQLGCEAMLELKDFYEDQLLLRQVKRAKRQEVAMEDDEDNSILPTRGTQMDPEDIDDADDVDDDDDDEAEQRRRHIAKIKRERMSRDPSVARSNHHYEEEDEEMED
ncbi:zinc-finger of the MIZ type in Nse subunit-domain-containing protein [Xylogone sp. PMI_703]|nr:zinc-finger of the MIZ type in Nse subunit-domain-containing protein [Xylogone sp. PMI_703]